MKNKIVRNDTPTISFRDDELTLIKKFKRYFFVILRSEIDITFYILRDRGSVDIDTTDYFGVSFSFEDGVPMISSIFSNKTKFTLKHSIETEFHNMARFTPLGKKEEITCINVHWPEPDAEDNQPESDEHDGEGVEVQYVPGYEHDVAPIPIPKSIWQTGVNIGPLNPIWLGEKIEPLKPVEDN